MLDVLQIYWVVPILFVIGFTLTLAMRPSDRGPITLDLSPLQAPLSALAGVRSRAVEELDSDRVRKLPRR